MGGLKDGLPLFLRQNYRTRRCRFMKAVYTYDLREENIQGHPNEVSYEIW